MRLRLSVSLPLSLPILELFFGGVVTKDALRTRNEES